ncbi:MAG TPA: glycosyltransferase family 2 protein [Blastocatellia bacterium]|nr:glycosyltransferase family 2 protein [Blastocatellia bacterium]
MYRNKRVAVVMPIHNEAARVQQALARVPSFVDLIIAVDDGSTDETARRLSEMGDSRLTVLTHSRNLGVGAATKTGYKRSLETDAELIAVMDGDGQMDGEDLGALLDRAIAGADYVKGNRFLDTTTIGRMPRARYVGNRVLSWLTGVASSFESELDAQCGYSVIRRAALKRLRLDELYDRYGFPNEMLFEACRAGLRVETARVKCIYEDEVSGINPITSVPLILMLIARNYLRRRPLATSSALAIRETTSAE